MNVISSSRRFDEMQSCRKKNCQSHLSKSSHGRIVKLAKLHNAERHFSESLFSRKSFSRIGAHPNVIFTNFRSAERRFPETSFFRTSFCRNYMKQNIISPNIKYSPRILLFNVLLDERLSKICVIGNWVRVWACLYMDTVRIREVQNSRYGRFDLIVVFVPLNAYSGKWCLAKRRFGKMAFG